MSRQYNRVHPILYPILVKLHQDFGLTYGQIAHLVGCSRSRVVQLIRQETGAETA